MTIIVQSPTTIETVDSAMRIWVATCAPEARYRAAVDALRLDLAPSADLLARRDCAELSSDGFISGYESALDALPDTAFIDVLQSASGRGLVLVTWDRLAGFVLRRYLTDWATRSLSAEMRMTRAAQNAVRQLASDSAGAGYATLRAQSRTGIGDSSAHRAGDGLSAVPERKGPDRSFGRDMRCSPLVAPNMSAGRSILWKVMQCS